MKAQLDENISPAFAHALDCLVTDSGHSVVHVTALHQRGTADTELLSQARRLGVDLHVTHDCHHRCQAERDAVVAGNLVVFVLTSGWESHSFFERASRLVHWWPRLITACATLRRPGIYLVPWRSESRRFQRVG
ncbi:DUF5615 family PIN-like protein [Bacillus sp. NP157]|nr:DUF5615 family PIN-like protein [Bacillus sp. NP157]